MTLVPASDCEWWGDISYWNITNLNSNIQNLIRMILFISGIVFDQRNRFSCNAHGASINSKPDFTQHLQIALSAAVVFLVTVVNSLQTLVTVHVSVLLETHMCNHLGPFHWIVGCKYNLTIELI